MNVVDSSAWLEYFANGPNASFFARPIEQVDELVMPSLSLFEVFKRVLQQRDENDAFRLSRSCSKARWLISMQQCPERGSTQCRDEVAHG